MIYTGTSPDSGDTTSLLVVFGVASIPALAAIVAAFVAARSAAKAKRAEIEADRLRRLEERVAEQKYAVYKPMIDTLGDLFDPQQSNKPSLKRTSKQISDFAIWVSIFGSDAAVQAFRNFMQASFHSPPFQVSLRLYGDFLIAARRDMGDPNTELDGLDVVAIRINDFYDTDMYLDGSMPLEEVFKKYSWDAPWLKAAKKK